MRTMLWAGSPLPAEFLDCIATCLARAAYVSKTAARQAMLPVTLADTFNIAHAAAAAALAASEQAYDQYYECRA